MSTGKDIFTNILNPYPLTIYSVSLSRGSDISMQAQLVKRVHTLCFCVRPSRCVQFHLDGACDFELPFANKLATSLPGDGDTEYM